ncbi:hypothetical protein ABG953_12565 [Enterococcus faecalis]|uniref:hypothetical protein n=1 Tax=Enterococcus faecalis TaxID=1351 RepID=UPI0019EB1C39|nr:hypothetical protein [Enterococcus faecalis]
MEDGNKESGYVLLYVLGAIILISITIVGIFMLARTVFVQVVKVDQFNRIQQVEEYAMQVGTEKIKKNIDEYIEQLTIVDFGDNISKISMAMDDLFSDFEISETGIGNSSQYSYEITLEDIVKENVTPYVLSNDGGDFGWKEETSTANPSNAINAQITFKITTNVKEKQKKRSDIEKKLNYDYIYQIQWNTVDIEQYVNDLDVWRNVVYSYYLPNSANRLSADSWMKKVDDIYRYSRKSEFFDYSNYDNLSTQNYGYIEGKLVDITDNDLLDFTSNGKILYSNLNFEGSLLLENGIQFEGDNQSAQLSVNNLFSLRSNGTKKNIIKNLNVMAGNGMYINVAEPQSYLAIVGVEKSVKTSNLLVNNTQKKDSDTTEGLLFGSGEIHVNTQDSAREFQFSNYEADALNKSPKDKYWNEFIKGSMVIASSNFYAGPISLGNEIQATENDKRKISVAGDFLMTNAKLSSTKEDGDLSYFKVDDNSTNPPSTLNLVGKSTNLTVDGMTFIDAPKSSRRKAISEITDVNEDTYKYFGTKEDWNTISLKDKATINFGYTGVEPFNLSIQKDSVLSMNLLPELAYFDPTFLINSVSEGTLNGKIILRTFNQEDAEKLKEELDQYRVPNYIATNDEEGQNGKVTIIKPENAAKSGSSQIISRTFSYVDGVKY